MQLTKKLNFELQSLYSIFYSFFALLFTSIIYLYIYIKLGHEDLKSWIIIVTIINFPLILDFISGDSLSKIVANTKNKNTILNLSFYLLLLFYLFLFSLYFPIVYFDIIKLDIFKKYYQLIYLNTLFIGFCKLDWFALDGLKKIEFKCITAFVNHFLFLLIVLFLLEKNNFDIIIYSYTIQNFLNFIFYRIYILRSYPLSIKKTFENKNYIKKIIYQGAIFNIQKLSKDIQEPIIKFIIVSLNYTNNLVIYDLTMKIFKSFDSLIYSFSRPYNFIFAKNGSINKLKFLLKNNNFIMLSILLSLLFVIALSYFVLAFYNIYNFQFELKRFIVFLLIIYSTYSISLFAYPINFYIQIRRTLKYNIQGNLIALFFSVLFILFFDLSTSLIIALLIGNLFSFCFNLRLLNTNNKVLLAIILRKYLLFLIMLLCGVWAVENYYNLI